LTHDIARGHVISKGTNRGQLITNLYFVSFLENIHFLLARLSTVFLTILTTSFNFFVVRQQSLLSSLSLLSCSPLFWDYFDIFCSRIGIWRALDFNWLLWFSFLRCNLASFDVKVVWFDHRFCLVLKLNLKLVCWWFWLHDSKEKLQLVPFLLLFFLNFILFDSHKKNYDYLNFLKLEILFIGELMLSDLV
jgi:hypothetical protein